MEDEDCDCPFVDPFFNRYVGSLSSKELERCEEKLGRARGEATELKQCRAKLERGAGFEKELKRCRSELARAEREGSGWRQAKELKQCRAERDRAQEEKAGQAKDLKRCRSERDRIEEKKDSFRVQLQEQNKSLQLLEGQVAKEQAARGKAEFCQAELQEARTARGRLERELQDERRSWTRMWSLLQAERDAKAVVELPVGSERRSQAPPKARQRQERSLSARFARRLRQAKRRLAGFLPGGLGCFAKAAWSLAVVGATSFVLWLSKQLASLRGELEEKRRLLRLLERDLGEVTDKAEEWERTDELQQDPGSAFAYMTSWQEGNEETVRCIKIRCPNVEPGDITVDVLFNGCAVSVARPGEARTKAWTKQFRFRISEGLFEFAEDQAKLEGGWLTLVFRPHASLTRVFRFPRPLGVETDPHSDIIAVSRDARAVL